MRCLGERPAACLSRLVGERTNQADIVDETGWSNATVSRPLSRLVHDGNQPLSRIVRDGDVSRVIVGQRKVVFLDESRSDAEPHGHDGSTGSIYGIDCRRSVRIT